MTDHWLFQLDSSVLCRPLQPAVVAWPTDGAVGLPGCVGVASVVFVGDKRKGGVRVVDPRLTADIARAPQAPPSVHNAERSQPFGGTYPHAVLAKVTGSNTATSMVGVCGLSTTVRRSALWVGWASGHISVLDTSTPPRLAGSQKRSESPTASLRGSSSTHRGSTPPPPAVVGASHLPIYDDWCDVMYAHRGAVCSLSTSHAGRFVVSCSYDMNVVLWDAPTRRQLRSLVGIAKNAPRASLLSNEGGAVDGNDSTSVGVCRVAVEVIVPCRLPSRGSREDAKGIESGAEASEASCLLLSFDGGLLVALHNLESQGASVDFRSRQEYSEDITGAATRRSLQDCVTAASSIARFSTTRPDSSHCVVCLGTSGGSVLVAAGNIATEATSQEVADQLIAWLHTDTNPRAASVLPPAGATAKVLAIECCGSASGALGGEEENSGVTSGAVEASRSLYAISYANHCVALVAVVVRSVLQQTVEAVVLSVLNVPSPVSQWSSPPTRPGTASIAERSSQVRILLAICADGTVLVLLLHHWHYYQLSSLSSSSRRIGNGGDFFVEENGRPWRHGDVRRQEAKLRDAIALVQRSKSAVVVADATVSDLLARQAGLVAERAALQLQVDRLQADAARWEQTSTATAEQLDDAEEKRASVRAELRHAEDEIRRLQSTVRDREKDLAEATDSLQRCQFDNHVQALKTEECLLQLHEELEQRRQLESAHETTERERRELLERTHRLEQEVTRLERDRRDTDHRTALLDEQQAIIKELQLRFTTLQREHRQLLHDYADEQEKRTALERRLTSAKTVLGTFAEAHAETGLPQWSDRAKAPAQGVVVGGSDPFPHSLSNPLANGTSLHPYARVVSYEQLSSATVPPVRARPTEAATPHVSAEPTDLASLGSASVVYHAPSHQRHQIAGEPTAADHSSAAVRDGQDVQLSRVRHGTSQQDNASPIGVKSVTVSLM